MLESPNTASVAAFRPIVAPAPFPTEEMDRSARASRTNRQPVSGRDPNPLAPYLLPLLAALVLGGLWEAWSHREGISMPGPLRVISESWELIRHPFYDHGGNDLGLGWQILSSLQRVGMGYGLACVVGIGLGILLGRVKAAHQAFDPIFQILRTIPPLAWLPIALATFNQAQPSAVFVIFVTALWPILINTATGIAGIPKDYLQVAQVYQVRGWRFFSLVMLPSAAPFLFAGLRIGVGLAWLAIVAAEMLTGGVGVGFFLWDSWNSGRLTDIVVAVGGIGMVGLALDRGVAMIAKAVGTTA